MGKKTLPNNRKTNVQPAANRSKGNLNNHRSSDAQVSLTAKQINQLVDRPNAESKNEVCSICLNQIEKPSLCSGCFHSFCFSCITKWANVSNNCPVCRKEYKTILHNFNTAVKLVKFNDEPSCRRVKRTPGDNPPVTANAKNNAKSNRKDTGPFYIFETGEQQMVGVPIINDEQVTNNIVQLNTNIQNNIPEIDIVNMTRNENGGRIITRHNYQLASADQQELINELITSAVNRSVEEHNETISQINSNNSSNSADEQQPSSILNQNGDSTRLIDIYTFDRTRRLPRRRNRNLFGPSRYNLRPIVGTRLNPQVNRTRLIEWNL